MELQVMIYFYRSFIVYRVIYAFAINYRNIKNLDSSDFIDPTDTVYNQTIQNIVPRTNFTDLVIPEPLIADTVVGVTFLECFMKSNLFYFILIYILDQMVDDSNHHFGRSTTFGASVSMSLCLFCEKVNHSFCLFDNLFSNPNFNKFKNDFQLSMFLFVIYSRRHRRSERLIN